jgi:hypothetical protein
MTMQRNIISENRMFRRIGGKLREDSRDIVEARLPERLRALLDRLAAVEEHGEAEGVRSIR